MTASTQVEAAPTTKTTAQKDPSLVPRWLMFKMMMAQTNENLPMTNMKHQARILERLNQTIYLSRLHLKVLYGQQEKRMSYSPCLPC
ncbi:hypothetical protein DVH05_002782 [Phytophthora capsici]|nr:hypothetical protein DVH05_002782 [Phytophthora capsici]